MSDDPRLAYCPLLVLASELGRRGGWCPDPRDCSSCIYFQTVLEDLGVLDSVYWICPRCLPSGRKPSGFTLLGHYSEEVCEVCETSSSLSQACVPPDLLPTAQWVTLVTEGVAEVIEREEEE